MRVCLHFLAVTVLCALCFAGDTGQNEAPQLHLMVSNDGEHFQYSMTHPELVRRAWIEVIDLPVLVDKKAVEVQPYGELDWEWNWSSLYGWENDEDQLSLAVWDPDGESLFCDGLAIRAEPGGEVSRMTVGGRTSFDPEPKLNTSLVRVAQDSPDFTFDVTGSDLVSSATFHIYSDTAAQCKDSSVHAEVLDLSHARLTIGSECLRKPGILFISTDAQPKTYEWDNVWIHIASKDSPELRFVSPSQERLDEPRTQVAFVLRGKRFTRKSEVYGGYLPTGGTPASPQLVFDTEYVSPTELRATVDASYGNEPLVESMGENRTGVPGSNALRIWVKGDDEKFELSQPRDVLVPFRTPAVITTVAPYPIKLMHDRSPAELKVTIHRENFIPENRVIIHSGSQQITLRTEFVSPTSVRAWLPRQLWRQHRIVYRLVTETAAGQQHSDEVESSVKE